MSSEDRRGTGRACRGRAYRVRPGQCGRPVKTAWPAMNMGAAPTAEVTAGAVIATEWAAVLAMDLDRSGMVRHAAVTADRQNREADTVVTPRAVPAMVAGTRAGGLADRAAADTAAEAEATRVEATPAEDTPAVAGAAAARLRAAAVTVAEPARAEIDANNQIGHGSARIRMEAVRVDPRNPWPIVLRYDRPQHAAAADI